MTDSAIGTEPVHDPGAEQAVLGAVMTSPGALAAIRDVLAPEHFYQPRHQAIFGACVALAARGAPVDPVTVGDYLEKTGELSRCGERPYLFDVVQRAGPAASTEYHAKIVRDRADRRSLREGLRRAEQLAARPDRADDEIAGTIADIRRVLDKTGDVRRSGEPADVGESSWQPIDLEPYVNGTVRRPTPTVGVSRSDGLRLLYPGREHAVIGEMEAGKSWFALACAAAEIDAGSTVIYVHFEESDPSDTVDRLRALGIDGEQIVKGLRFVAPGQPVTIEVLWSLLNPTPSLVVLDGVNEGMALHRLGVREEDGVAAFRRRLIIPCTTIGAAVLLCDHVVKDRETRGRYALGSVHKGNALSGALIVLDNAEPFGRGRRGASHVFVTKDRPGHLRRNGKETRVPGKTYLGTLIVDDERAWKDYLDVAFVEPSETGEHVEPDNPHAEIEEHVLNVVRLLVESGETTTGRKIRAKSSYGTDTTLKALERLVIDQKLSKKSGPGRSHVFTVSDAPGQVVRWSGSKDPGTTGPPDHLSGPDGPRPVPDHPGPPDDQGM